MKSWSSFSQELTEKKANKDYDGDGKVESGSKEHAGVVHNAIQRAKGKKADGQDTRKEEVEQVAEADSLAAMAARREKRLAAQRKREGTTGAGHDFGHDHGISDAERKKRQQKEFDAFIGRGKKTKKEEFAFEGVRDDKTAERKARLEKKRGMKLDDHPQYKKEAFAFSEEDFEELDLFGEEIDAMTDEQLIDMMEDFILETAEDDQDLIEICEHLEGVEMLAEDYYDSAVKSSKAASKTPEAKAGRRKLRMQRLKSAAKGAAKKVGAAAKAAAAKAKPAAKAAAKGAVRGAGYAAGLAKRAAASAKSEFKKGKERGEKGSGGGSSSSSSSSSSNTAPQCGHSESLSFTRPSQISQANMSSSSSPPPSFSVAPSLERNMVMAHERSYPFRASSV